LSLAVFINAIASIFISDDFIYGLGFAIEYDGAIALIMTMIMIFDKDAWKHALILAFAVMCHSMVLLHFITETHIVWLVSKPFYHIYDELIIVVALLQMWISKNGIVNGVNNSSRYLQGLLFRAVFHSNRIRKGLLAHTKRKG
jgi:hypothetical protein